MNDQQKWTDGSDITRADIITRIDKCGTVNNRMWEHIRRFRNVYNENKDEDVKACRTLFKEYHQLLDRIRQDFESNEDECSTIWISTLNDLLNDYICRVEKPIHNS